MTAGFGFAALNGGVELFNYTATANETLLAAQTTQVAAASRLTSGVNRLVPDAAHTAVLLPLNQGLGAPIVVANYGAVALTVFPAWDDVNAVASGGKINNGAANAVFSVAAGKSAIFYPLPSKAGVATAQAVGGTDWAATLSA